MRRYSTIVEFIFTASNEMVLCCICRQSQIASFAVLFSELMAYSEQVVNCG